MRNEMQLLLSLNQPKRATLDVTLEPCCHYGKTPPCTEAILEQKIKKVVIGSRDPNPKVAGKGAKILRDAGVAVVEDFMRDKCDELNPIFFHYITTKTPYVVMKYAMTLDGKIATKTGASKWITQEAARREVQYMRHRYMGIMVGIGTVLADDPMLNVRVEGLKSPVRIICDSKLRIPLDSQIVKSAREYRTIVAYADLENVEKKKEILQTMGVETVFCPDMKKHVNLKHLMEYLGKENIDSILLEGGGTLNDSALLRDCPGGAGIYCTKNLWRSRKPDSGGWNWDRASVSGSGTKVQRYLPDWRRPKNYLSGLKKRTGGIMFTGIVEEVGKVRYIQLNGNSGVLAVKAAKVLEGTKIGDSIAVNGVCLTVTSLQPDGFTADVMAETIRRSSLGNCKIGSYVNLERAMAADGRFGRLIL